MPAPNKPAPWTIIYRYQGKDVEHVRRGSPSIYPRGTIVRLPAKGDWMIGVSMVIEADRRVYVAIAPVDMHTGAEVLAAMDREQLLRLLVTFAGSFDAAALVAGGWTAPQ